LGAKKVSKKASPIRLRTSSLKPKSPRKRKSQATVAAECVATVSSQQLRAFGVLLRRWYRDNARDLPWRKTRDPYRVLVSELMLQQTQVSRVVDYYAAFLNRFPSLHDVAQAPVAHVLEQWEGLGYYARARNLHKLAGLVVNDGQYDGVLPSEPAHLAALPGIGAYTAGAVASFAYERRAPLVDTNVARVLLRVFTPRFTPKSPQGQKVAWALAKASLPRTGQHAWTHNQALMELGALVCRAHVSACAGCPVKRVCATAASAKTSILP
jgi:A/G-specific adenine glycosylase